jgi:P-type Cu+ transporter
MATVTDPVCGMVIESDDAAGTAEHAGTKYYFCSLACLEAFEADPTAYV